MITPFKAVPERTYYISLQGKPEELTLLGVREVRCIRDDPHNPTAGIAAFEFTTKNEVVTLRADLIERVDYLS